MLEDVRTGGVIVLAGTASNPGGDGVRPAGVMADAGFPPLSTVKLMLAASWLQHEGSIDAQARQSAPDLNEMLVEGHDAPGRGLALLLRQTVGSEAVLADLARFGFPACAGGKSARPFSPPACVEFSAKTSDEDWASALSIGEANITVSLPQLSGFLRAVGSAEQPAPSLAPAVEKLPGNMVSAATAMALEAAMQQAVERGTAKGIRGRLGENWKMGGKTGTGGGHPPPYDGIFAGLVFDEHGRAVYTVICYVRRGGLGGGAAAEIAADVARFVLGL